MKQFEEEELELTLGLRPVGSFRPITNDSANKRLLEGSSFSTTESSGEGGGGSQPYTQRNRNAPPKKTLKKVADEMSTTAEPQLSAEAKMLTRMPLVSATGDENGKTITGFLYRYRESEVCIVCVCHGKSFSPAGFVNHAGGANVDNPLKHVKVVSLGSSFILDSNIFHRL